MSDEYDGWHEHLYCPDCGRELARVHKAATVGWLEEFVAHMDKCECGASPWVAGVRFE